MDEHETKEMTEEEKQKAREWNAAIRYYESGEYETRRAVEDMERDAEERAHDKLWSDEK